eukprot:scaffold28471_cov17-Prasinocladus_malaysianus.AAC.1
MSVQLSKRNIRTHALPISLASCSSLAGWCILIRVCVTKAGLVAWIHSHRANSEDAWLAAFRMAGSRC